MTIQQHLHRLLFKLIRETPPRPLRALAIVLRHRTALLWSSNLRSHTVRKRRSTSLFSHERKDLFSDLRKTHDQGDDAGHFMAAVVSLRRGKQLLGTDEYFVMDVVDGQQRLTTLIVLLKSLSLKLDGTRKDEKKLAEELEHLLVKAEEEELLLLQTNHDSSHYFANFLRNGQCPMPVIAKTLADRELLNAVAECNGFVRKWCADGLSLVSLAALFEVDPSFRTTG